MTREVKSWLKCNVNNTSMILADLWTFVTEWDIYFINSGGCLKLCSPTVCIHVTCVIRFLLQTYYLVYINCTLTSNGMDTGCVWIQINLSLNSTLSLFSLCLFVLLCSWSSKYIFPQAVVSSQPYTPNIRWESGIWTIWCDCGCLFLQKVWLFPSHFTGLVKDAYSIGFFFFFSLV